MYCFSKEDLRLILRIIEDVGLINPEVPDEDREEFKSKIENTLGETWASHINQFLPL